MAEPLKPLKRLNHSNSTEMAGLLLLLLLLATPANQHLPLCRRGRALLLRGWRGDT
jgi:hypothetical protein